MNIRTATILSCLFVAFASSTAGGAEYFVNKTGDDTNEGRSRDAAFQTVQRGVDALEPGDTLTIGPGEYREAVQRDNLGDDDHDTLIRAELPGTVLLRGDVPAPTFDKVEGFRFIYAAEFDQPVQTVNETDTLTILETTPRMEDLEYEPGKCYYDEHNHKLYIATSDLQPPSAHHYTVSVTPAFGLLLTEPIRVTVDGLAATGFHNREPLRSSPGYEAAWGIMFADARHCTIRNSTAYFNAGGIAVRSSGDGAGHNLIEKSTAFANYGRFGTEGGNICVFGSNHDTIRDVYAYIGDPNGIRHYGAGIRGPALLADSLVWGASYADVFLKGGPVSEFGMTRNTITLGILHSHNVEHSIIGTKNQYNRSPGEDNILYAKEARDVRDKEFADPDNLDFRLQATSKFRSKYGADLDRGPFPYEPNIFYVRNDGDDQADGLSVRNAWRTLDHALSQLRAGDTLYLEPGDYELTVELNVTGDADQPVHIRGRGTEPAVIHGALRAAQSAHLNFERLNFTDAVSLDGGRAIRMDDCRFAAGGLVTNNVEGLTVTNTTFADAASTAVAATRCTDLFLSSNIYASQAEPAVTLDDSQITYSNYNSYAAPDTAWAIDGSPTSLTSLRPEHEAQAISSVPELRIIDGIPSVDNAVAFAGRGRLGTDIGVYHEFRQRDLQYDGPRLHSVTDTTANLEWWTSVSAITEIAWGTTPECENRETVGTRIDPTSFNTFSLTDLEPNTTYYVRLTLMEPANNADRLLTRSVTPDDAPLSFTTSSAPPEPRTYYVANDGDDHASGLNRDEAWRSVSHAAGQVNAGDTVLIAEGTYAESVRLRATGKLDMPIIFKAIPGERAEFNGQKGSIGVAFHVEHKQYVHFDSLYFRRYGKQAAPGWRGIISFTESDHVRVTRCYMNGYGGGVLSTHFIYGGGGSDMLIKNCVIANGMYGAYFTQVEDLRIENNVFLRPLITEWNNSGRAEARHNVFVDSQPYKSKVHLFELGGDPDQHLFENNVFYLRMADEERKPFLFYGGGPGRTSVAAYAELTGRKTNVVTDPGFAITVDADPVNRDGEKLDYLGDWVVGRDGLDFPDLFLANDQLNERGIGLIPEDFEDFHFHQSEARERSETD